MRLRKFIRRRVPDPRDAKDILQETFYKRGETHRLLMPIAHVIGRLNLITDFFRKRTPKSFSAISVSGGRFEHVPPEEQQRLRERKRERFGIGPSAGDI